MSIYIESLNKVLNELNTQAVKKVGKAAWGTTKKIGKTIGNRLGKAADTAQNAIVAGVAAPVGTTVANKVQNRKATKKKNSNYNSDVATMSAVLSKSESLIEVYMKLEEGRPKGSKNKPKPGAVPKMASKVHTSKAPKPQISAVQQARNELIASQQAAKDQLKNTNLRGEPLQSAQRKGRVLSMDPKNVARRLKRAEDKKGTIEKMTDIANAKVARGIPDKRKSNPTIIDKIKKSNPKKITNKASKSVQQANNLRTKFTKIRKLMNKSAAKHFAAGALVTGAAVGINKGINKLRNRNKNKEIF